MALRHVGWAIGLQPVANDFFATEDTEHAQR